MENENLHNQSLGNPSCARLLAGKQAVYHPALRASFQPVPHLMDHLSRPQWISFCSQRLWKTILKALEK